MQEIDSLLELMESLRNPRSGCPWDREQTISSIIPFTIEEVHELAEAVGTNDPGAIRDELGDLLFHIVFCSRIAEESGYFNFREVVTSLEKKLKRRHPHVFGNEKMPDAKRQTVAWERIKRRERQSANPGEQGLLDGISKALPALLYANKLQRRAAGVGFDWTAPDAVIAKVEEETAEIRQALQGPVDKKELEEEIGDLLFSCVNLARHLEIDAEAALRSANRKFQRRFAYIESVLAGQGHTLEESTPDEMENLWNEAKASEQDSTGHTSRK